MIGGHGLGDVRGCGRVFYWDCWPFLLDWRGTSLLSLYLWNWQHSSFLSQLNPVIQILSDKENMAEKYDFFFSFFCTKYEIENAARMRGCLMQKVHLLKWKLVQFYALNHHPQMFVYVIFHKDEKNIDIRWPGFTRWSPTLCYPKFYLNRA